MCGILAQLGTNINKNNFIDALNLQQSRGPDNRSVRSVGENLMFGHARLSIIDVAEVSNQPMESDSSILVFNGEIYNYLEIKAELSKDSIEFKTNSDTEVLQKALDHWGIDAIKKLNGMWAFVYYNKHSEEIIVSRDRFGKKPLYYSEFDSGAIFSSEIKSIYALTKKRRILNRSFITAFLCFHYWPNNTEETFYEGILQVMPGETFVFKSNKFKNKVINDSNTIANYLSDCTDEIKLGSIIDNAVKIRLRSDVPVGIFISGGIDSTIVAANATKYSDNIFWITGNTNAGNDLKFSRQVAKDLNIDLEEININYDEDMLTRIEKMTEYFEVPLVLLGNSVAMNTLYQNVSERGIKVVLDGTGGDEVFGGYFDHYSKYIINTYLSSGEIGNFMKYISQVKKHNQYSVINMTSDVISYYLCKYLRCSFDFRKGLFTSLNCDRSLTPNGKNYSANLNEFMKYDMNFGRLQMWLKMNDMNSMMYSVESRSPLLDYRLLNFLNNDISNKFNKGFNKYLLRKAVPESISDNVTWRRDKQGFRWVQSKLLRENYELIKSKILESKLLKEIFTNSELEEIFQGSISTEQEQLILRCFSVCLLDKTYKCDLSS